MAKCVDDCLHYPVCSNFRDNICERDLYRSLGYRIPSDGLCEHFKNKADVVEVTRGHWIEDEVGVYACSECGFIFTADDDISEFKYCRCGAKMDGKG